MLRSQTRVLALLPMLKLLKELLVLPGLRLLLMLELILPALVRISTELLLVRLPMQLRFPIMRPLLVRWSHAVKCRWLCLMPLPLLLVIPLLLFQCVNHELHIVPHSLSHSQLCLGSEDVGERTNSCAGMRVLLR